MKNIQAQLVFPEPEAVKIETPTVSLKEIISLSEKMLPFENKRRKKSDASSYSAFKLD